MNFESIENILSILELQSKSLQLQLIKGELKWEDTDIQFFIPIILGFTNFDWLKLIAEHALVKEDETVVKNFLTLCESLKEVNSQNLENATKKQNKRGF